MSIKSLLRVSTLSAATLLLEGTLTRLLSVAQFYHFAFLVISLALLGFGASGTILYLTSWNIENKIQHPNFVEHKHSVLMSLSALGFAIGVALSYIVINFIPFDSYSIAWDRRQIILFFIYYLSLTLPFLFAGIGIGGSLILAEGSSNFAYAANLLGSGVGAFLAPFALWLAGVPGAVLMAGLLALMSGFPHLGWFKKANSLYYRLSNGILICFLGSGWVTFGYYSLLNLQGRAPLGIDISPYKSLSYVLRLPESRILYARWNAFSRADVVAADGIHQFPGLSYAFQGDTPNQYGISIDGESLQPITLVTPEEFKVASYLPESLAFSLRPQAKILVIEPGGGIGVLQSLSGGAGEVTAVLSNPLVVRAARFTGGEYDVYKHSRVRVVIENPRIFVKRTEEFFDIIFVPLTDAYRPITSGAYSLVESYDLTVEAFIDLLSQLKNDGIFVITRWIQTPPSECIKLTATIVEAMEQLGIPNIQGKLIAYRGIQTMTILVQLDGWSKDELVKLREFATERRFDLVWSPDVKENETNLYNRLPKSYYYLMVRDLFNTLNRGSYYRNYPYAIAPAIDDKPFFFHFFTWKQTPELVATLGKVWQPFGGSGYFILLALLFLVILLSVLLILIPLSLSDHSRIDFRLKEKREFGLRIFAYFGLIGLAFLFVEIPLIQRWILLLGQATYAFTVVISSLLVSSSLGSMMVQQKWLPGKYILGAVVLWVALTPLLTFRIANIGMNLSFELRILIAVIILIPLGFFMGFPFPLGLIQVERKSPEWIPWVWGVNGCASVISSVLAALLTISFGFSTLLLLGGIMYLGAFLMFPSERNETNKT